MCNLGGGRCDSQHYQLQELSSPWLERYQVMLSLQVV